MENDTTTTAQVTDPAEELRLIRQALLLLEARIDEQESRVNALAALSQQQVKDLKIVIEGYEILTKAVKGHHDLIQSIALALPQRHQSTTLQ